MTSFAEARPWGPQPEVAYDSRFVTAFGTKVVFLNGKYYEIHQTNSLPIVVESVIAHEVGEQPRSLYEVQYRARVDSEPVLQDAVLSFLAEQQPVSDAIKEILKVRAHMKPEPIYKPTIELLADVEAHSDDTLHGLQEDSVDDPLRDYYFSLAFDEFAARARTQDPSYRLENFVE